MNIDRFQIKYYLNITPVNSETQKVFASYNDG